MRWRSGRWWKNQIPECIRSTNKEYGSVEYQGPVEGVAEDFCQGLSVCARELASSYKYHWRGKDMHHRVVWAPDVQCAEFRDRDCTERATGV